MPRGAVGEGDVRQVQFVRGEVGLVVLESVGVALFENNAFAAALLGRDRLEARLVHDARRDGRVGVEHDTLPFEGDVSAEQEQAVLAAARDRAAPFQCDDSLDDRSRGDARQRCTQHALVAEHVLLFLGGGLGDRFRIEGVDGAVFGDHAGGDDRLVVVPRRPRRTGRAGALDAILGDDVIDPAEHRLRAAVQLKRDRFLVEQIEDVEVFGVNLLRRGQQSLRIGAERWTIEGGLGKKGSRTGKDGCNERGADKRPPEGSGHEIPIGQGWTCEGG